MGKPSFKNTINNIKGFINDKNSGDKKTVRDREPKRENMSGFFNRKNNKELRNLGAMNNNGQYSGIENDSNLYNPDPRMNNQNNMQNDVGYEPMINQVSGNMFGDSNIKGWNNYQESEDYLNNYYEDIDKPVYDKNKLYETEKEALIRTRQLNRENMPPPEKPNRFMKNKNMLRDIKNNDKVSEAAKMSRFGIKRAEDFIVGDVKGVRREKVLTDDSKKDYRVSISKDDYDNKYNVLPEENRPQKKEKKGFFSNKKLKRNEENKKRKEIAIEEQSVEKNYQFLRKEVDGYSPLYKLDFLDKIRVTRRYLDEKSGKTARKEAERFQKEQRKKIEMQAQVKRKLREQLVPLINRQAKMQRISVVLPPGKHGVLDEVLRQDVFSMFNIRKIQPNPNLDIYKVNVPILLEFTLIGDPVSGKK